MEIRLFLFSIMIVVSFLSLVLIVIRRGHLSIRYGLLWLGSGIIWLILALFPGLLNIISNFLGILSPINALFLLGIFLIMFVLLGVTIVISRLSEKIRHLTQSIAIEELYLTELKRKIEKAENKIS